LAWVGTRTDNAEPTVAFFRDVLRLPLELDRPGFWMLKLPDGGKVEVFGPDSPVNRHFTTGPVVEILLEPESDDSGNAWVHFRAPDGNIYELTQDPGVSRPHETWSLQLAADPPSPTRRPLSGWGADRRVAAVGR
jgi:catechol 2,3-dioxygenase-like lactoylglutathione lyase family enzyme